MESLIVDATLAPIYYRKLFNTRKAWSKLNVLKNSPTNTAPRNSQIPAATIACLNVKLRDETAVAKLFATSFA